MDLVLNRLQNTAISPNESGDKQTNFDSLYKNWGKLGNQDERRKELLGVQKSDRNATWDKCRGILELVQTVEEDSIFRIPNKAYYKPTIYVAGFNKAPSYGQVLMFSEWMIEKPFDFDTNWFVVPAPKGTRTLVVASNGITKLYTKYGHFLFECRTALPGGNPCDPKSKVNCCVLDCFYQKKGNILHVLDILAWNSQPMTDGELEFRDYWLKSKFFELDGIRYLGKRNQLVFNLLPKVSCEPEKFARFMMKTHFDGDATVLDGLLFFHKRAHYFSGETPLVGWLYPYMVPEVLGSHISVNQAYMLQKPEKYTNQAEFIMEFNMKAAKKVSKVRSRKNSSHNKMDTTDVGKSKVVNNVKPKTESMEAEATPDSTDTTTLTAAMEPETVTKEPTTTAEMDADTSATMDAVIPASMDAVIPASMDAVIPASVDAVIPASVDAEIPASSNAEIPASMDAEISASNAETPVALDSENSALVDAEITEKKDEPKA